MPDTPDAPAYRHVQTYRMLWVVLLVTAGFGGVMLAEAPTGRSGASWGGLLLMAAGQYARLLRDQVGASGQG